MAMKFDSFSRSCCALVMLLGIFGCASTPKPKEVSLALNKDEKPLLLTSEQYIPQRTKDAETGLILPYVIAVDPYTQQKGRIDSESVSAFISAKKAMRNGETILAEKILHQLAKDNLSLSGPWVMLGDIAKLNNQYQQSVDAYAKAISINKSNLNAYIRLARLQREHGDFVRAQNTYIKALSQWRDFPEAHLNLAILYDIYLNQSVKAQRHLEAYQFLTNGKNQQSGDWLAEIQQRTGEPIKLLVETKKATSLAVSL